MGYESAVAQDMLHRAMCIWYWLPRLAAQLGITCHETASRFFINMSLPPTSHGEGTLLTNQRNSPSIVLSRKRQRLRWTTTPSHWPLFSSSRYIYTTTNSLDKHTCVLRR